MTHEWKPGDFAMVEIGSIDLLDGINGSRRFSLKAGKYDWDTVEVRGQVLRPLPTTDPITDLERAVVEAAINQMEAQPEHSTIPFRTAVNALRARRPPKPIDPEKELFDAHCAVMMAFAKPKTLPGVAQTRIAVMEMWRVALESMRKSSHDA